MNDFDVFFSFILAVTATQNYVLEQFHKQDLQFEKAFYNEIVRNRMFQEKQLEKWKSYLARTSKYPLLMVRLFSFSH